uniref:BHLH domain-containing protein n=2 Tax=Populus trichocarpa TaxID=3694 RepID=A0A2K1XTL1_POPTR|eukprot:XP_006375391.2 transcription factor bHLH67 isoform X1 [Populus trichocarpa]
MERLQGPINSCFLEEHSLDLGCFDQVFINTESLRFEEEEPHISSPSFEDKMPFLQMLQTVETPPFFPYKEPSFQTLLKLQHLQKPWNMNTFYMPETDTQVQPLELESCVTHDIVDLHSPVKSETKEHPNPHSNSCLEGVSPEPAEPNSDSSIPWRAQPQTVPNMTTHFSESSTLIITRERRKRKRTRATKNKEEVESQRMNHIAVERNRRRLMNDHLNSLRSLMTPSYIQKGDQASIIGGAIDFVKELEQLVQSLEAQKKIREIETASTAGISPNQYSTSQPQCDLLLEEGGTCEEERTVKKKSEATEIEVAAVQNHVNLKIKCQRIPGQLLRAIVALEDLGLTVLHLNITSSQATVLYSFNLKLEDNCKLGSTDEVAAAAHQIFSSISG